MSIRIIAAVARNNAIGYNNKLLYWLPSDLRRFKQLTTGHTIIMGRNTFLSLPKGALPNRRNIVLSHTVSSIDGCEVYGSLDEALEKCSSDEEVYILGGASVYAQAMDRADMLCLTEVDDIPDEADAFFPDYSSWIEAWSEEHTKDEKHSHDFRFVDYKRPGIVDDDKNPHVLTDALEQRVQKAVELFMEGYNCSQSVVAAFADMYGMNRDTALRVSAGFGGGVGRLRMICGAVSGSVMIAGMYCGQTEGDDRQGKASCYKEIQEIIEEFKRENGSVICAELLGLNGAVPTGSLSYVPAERNAAYYAKRPCAQKVESAARILARHIMMS